MATVTTSMARRRRARRQAALSTTALLVGVIAIGGSIGYLVYAAGRFSESVPDVELNLPSSVETSFAPAAMGNRTPRWSTATGTTFAAAPVVVDGRVFVREEDGRLGAFDSRTGAALWSVQVGGAPLGTVDFAPVVVDGVVYVSGGDRSALLDVAGRGPSAAVHALDAVTGSRRWTAPIGGLGGAPLTVAGDDVYVDADVLIVLDRVTGVQRWTAPVGNAPTSGYSRPAVTGDSVFVGGGDGRVHAFDRSTGAPRWSTQVGVGADIDAGPNVTATEQLLYVTSPDEWLNVIGQANGRGHLRALDPATGAARWVQPIKGVHVFGSNATASGGIVYVQGSALSAWDAVTGAPRWTAASGGSTTYSFNPLTVAGGAAYVPGGDGKLHAVDALTGSRRWTGGSMPPPGRNQSKATESVPVPPAVADGVIYLASGDHHLYAYVAP